MKKKKKSIYFLTNMVSLQKDVAFPLAMVYGLYDPKENELNLNL